jgi:hypothetical protein
MKLRGVGQRGCQTRKCVSDKARAAARCKSARARCQVARREGQRCDARSEGVVREKWLERSARRGGVAIERGTLLASSRPRQRRSGLTRRNSRAGPSRSVRGRRAVERGELAAEHHLDGAGACRALSYSSHRWCASAISPSQIFLCRRYGALQKILGHSSVRTTERSYAPFAPAYEVGATAGRRDSAPLQSAHSQRTPFPPPSNPSILRVYGGDLTPARASSTVSPSAL